MNELALCIVNEGSDYQARLTIARLNSSLSRFGRWSMRVEIEARDQRLQFGTTFTVEQMAQAVVELEAYYKEHIKNYIPF